jgi:hypothetical protein
MRDRLSARLEEIVRGHVERYSTADNVDAEFVREWSLLGDYLQQHGGLEETVRRSYADFEPSRRRRWTTKVAVTA